jgi:hypothetical protein
MPSFSSPDAATEPGGDVACEVIPTLAVAYPSANCRESFSGYAIGFTGPYLDNNFDEITLPLQQRMSSVTGLNVPSRSFPAAANR